MIVSVACGVLFVCVVCDFLCLCIGWGGLLNVVVCGLWFCVGVLTGV